MPVDLSDPRSLHRDPGLESIAAEMQLVGQLLHSRGIFAGRAGNISARLPDGRMLITRSGTHKGLLDRSALLLLDEQGRPLEQGRASSETPLHLAAYAVSSEISAVIHAHATACTTLAMLAQPLDTARSEEGRVGLGLVPLLPPADAGDPEAAARWAAAIRAGAKAALLAQHGVIVWGRDLRDALARIETCEALAELQWRMQLAQALNPDKADQHSEA
jgi:ribulose-5-phosphate 4-epimerase/fuculose-1-phosphate aldolase